MPYRLKKSELAFQVTREGKFEYRRYKHGEIYDEVPPEDAHRFEKIDAEAPREEETAPPGTRREKIDSCHSLAFVPFVKKGG